jgi:hypothetical protein
MRNQIFLIQVEVEPDRWVPMYTPCYSVDEAERKRKTKKYVSKNTRIVVYVPAHVVVVRKSLGGKYYDAFDA